jgi:hypothetical protein
MLTHYQPLRFPVRLWLTVVFTRIPQTKTFANYEKKIVLHDSPITGIRIMFKVIPSHGLYLCLLPLPGTARFLQENQSQCQERRGEKSSGPN